MFRVKNFLFFWLPPVIWMGLIYYLSSFHKIQITEVGWQNFVTRKFAHLTEYAILNLLFYRALFQTTRLSNKKSLFLAFFMTVFYSLTDEFHQTRVAGRTGRPFDVGVDSLGALIGLIISGKIINRLPKNFRRLIIK